MAQGREDGVKCWAPAVILWCAPRDMLRAAQPPAQPGSVGMAAARSPQVQRFPLENTLLVIPAAEAISHTRCLSFRTRKKKKKILKLLHNPSNECNQGHAATNGSLPTSQCIEVRLYSSSSMETLIFTQWHSEQLLLTHILQHSRKKNAIVGLGLLFLLQCW